MATIIVFGGTGFVGSGIVKKLVGHHRVKVFTRKTKPSSKNIPGVEYISGNLFNEFDVENAMKNCDVVINAAQFDNAPFENPRKGLTYEKVDGEGTENIVRAAKKMSIPRILYISGAGVEEGKTEPWFRAKLRAENAIKNSGITYTIFRPSWIYGENDKSLNRMIPMVRYSPFIFMLGKGYRVQPIYIDDVGLIVSASIDFPKTYNQIYELGGPEALTIQEILHTVSLILNKKRIYIHVPKILAGILFSILEKVPGVPVTRAALDFITMNVVISEKSQKKVENDYNFQTTSLKKGLKKYL